MNPVSPVIELVPLKNETWPDTPLDEVLPETQAPFTKKQPLAREIPLLKVLVAEPVMLRAEVCRPPVKVEVALPETVKVVPTLSAPVVVEFDEVELPKIVLPRLAKVAKRLVLEAVVEKKLVEVELVVVELRPVKF